MFIKKINTIFPLGSLWKLLLILAIGLQVIVLSQMYFFRNDIFSNPLMLVTRLFRGTLLTFIAGFLLAYPHLLLIGYLNQVFAWKSKPILRVLFQFLFSIVAGVMITPVILVPAGLVFGMEFDVQTIINNAYYLVILSSFLMAILEGRTYFNESIVAKTQALELEKKLLEEQARKEQIKRKQAELEAKNLERNFFDLMDTLPQPVFDLDLEGNLEYSNKAGYDFFGDFDFQVEKKQSALNFFVEEDIPRIVDKFKRSAMGLPTEPGEFTAIKKDGTLCPVLIFGNPIYNNDIIVGRRGIIIDISERKKYEVSLLEAKNELEQINDNLEQLVEERSRELLDANSRLLRAQEENLQSQFEVLRQQINPHFLFNSLNVLSGLIGKDVKQAQLFIDEFSHIYRYVLETLEQPVASLAKELDFMRSYLYLQQIRYGENLTWTVNIPSQMLRRVMPPLSLQVVLENAIKHNIVNESKPLLIELLCVGQVLLIRNNLQPKISQGTSTGLGLKNLVKRYALISDQIPEFFIENQTYVARLPLINPETDEHIDR